MNAIEELEQAIPKGVRRSVRFGVLTTMGVGGAVANYFRPRSRQELIEVVGFLHRREIPTFYLGGGSNCVGRDEPLEGAVVGLRGLMHVEFRGEVVVAEAGVSLARLVKQAARRGLRGLEGLAGIPGTVGGAAFMNAGGLHGDVASVLRSLLLFDLRSGTVLRLSRSEVPFGYRSSGLEGGVVIEVELGLAHDDPREVGERTREVFDRKRATQPLGVRSAGCAFRNPPGDSAGRLIDSAGLKGLRVGGAWVSERHANFVCAEKGARASDVWNLIGLVRERVLSVHDVGLELEVKDPWRLISRRKPWENRVGRG